MARASLVHGELELHGAPTNMAVAENALAALPGLEQCCWWVGEVEQRLARLCAHVAEQWRGDEGVRP
jgi:hypothetical protein